MAVSLTLFSLGGGGERYKVPSLILNVYNFKNMEAKATKQSDFI